MKRLPGKETGLVHPGNQKSQHWATRRDAAAKIPPPAALRWHHQEIQGCGAWKWYSWGGGCGASCPYAAAAVEDLSNHEKYPAPKGMQIHPGGLQKERALVRKRLLDTLKSSPQIPPLTLWSLQDGGRNSQLQSNSRDESWTLWAKDDAGIESYQKMSFDIQE